MDVSRYADFLAFASDLAVPLPGGPAPLGARMADFQRQDFAALAASLSALASGTMPPIRRYWLERTKGASKDTDATVALLWLLAFASRAVRCQVIADDQQQASEVRLIVEGILAIDAPLNSLLRQVVRVQKASIIGDRNGSMVEILTRDDSGSHGARPDLVLANELSHIGDEGFASTILDNADKVPTSVVIVATNAGFSDGWQYRWRQIADSSPRWYFATVTEPAPWISADDLAESQRRNPPSRYARLWRGVWQRGTGDALDMNAVASCVTLDGPMTAADSDYVFVGGLDLGIKHDHSGLVMLGIHRQTRRRRLALVRRWAPGADGKVDLLAVQAGVKAACELFHPREVRYDPYQAALMATQLRRDGCRMTETPFVGVTLNEMASEMLETFNARNIDLFNDTGLTRDLARLTIVEKSYGVRLESVRDADGHADSATALALALLAAKHIPAGGAFDVSVYLDGQHFSSAPKDEVAQQKQVAEHRNKQGALARFMPRFLSSFGRGEQDEERRPVGRAKIVSDPDLPGPVTYVDTSRAANRQRQPPPAPRSMAEVEQQLLRLDALDRAYNSQTNQ